MAKSKKSGSLISDIKDQIKRSGSNKGKFIYFKPGLKIRVRFLQDMDEGLKVLFHDSFQAGVNVPCQELFDKECGHCEDDALRHRDQYMWCVYDYDAKEVKILMGPVNNVSPIPHLVGMYEAYGTLVDRDYIITKNGSGTTATFTVAPMDKVKFKNTKVKPFSESKMLELLDKAFPDDSSDDDDEDETKKKKKAPKKTAGKKKVKEEEPEDDEDEDEDDEEEETKGYEDMSAKELYKLCVERGIKCKPKKDEDYYIELLEEHDEDDDDEDEEDEW